MEAVIQKDIDQARELIMAGEDVCAVEGRDFPRGGNPVLRYAIDSQSLDMVRLLLEAGADANDITASPLIFKYKNSNVRNLSLLSHAINIKAPLEIIEELINWGAYLDGSPKIFGDWSALMIAAYKGHLDIVKLLISYEADISEVNSYNGKSALDCAQEQGHVKVVKYLKSLE